MPYDPQERERQQQQVEQLEQAGQRELSSEAAHQQASRLSVSRAVLLLCSLLEQRGI